MLAQKGSVVKSGMSDISEYRGPNPVQSYLWKQLVLDYGTVTVSKMSIILNNSNILIQDPMDHIIFSVHMNKWNIYTS